MRNEHRNQKNNHVKRIQNIAMPALLVFSLCFPSLGMALSENTPEREVLDAIEAREVAVTEEATYTQTEGTEPGTDGAKIVAVNSTTAEIIDTMQGNNVSGLVWVDENENGVMDNDEDGLSGFAVKLYPENDLTGAVATSETGLDGIYMFTDIAPGRYVLGIEAQELSGIEYLLPLKGYIGDNRFALMGDGINAYSDVIDIQTNSDIRGLNAGVRTQPKIQPQSFSSGIFTINNPNGNLRSMIETDLQAFPFNQTVPYDYSVVESIVIDGALTDIDCSFIRSRLTNLKELDISEATDSFPNGAFAHCKSIETVRLPADVAISNEMFDGCSGLKTLGVGSGELTSGVVDLSGFTATFGLRAFFNCTAIEAVKLPADVELSNFMFVGCISLTTLGVGSGALAAGIVDFSGFAATYSSTLFTNCSSIEIVKLPPDVSISSFMFLNCINLDIVLFQGNMAPGIDTGAFMGTSAIAYVPDKTSGGYELTGFTQHFLEVRSIVLPSFSAHPQPQTKIVGQSASFIATAVAGDPIPYTLQWQFSTEGGGTWSDIAGETNDTLSLSDVSLSQDGYQYRCVATSLMGISVSNSAFLTVSAPPPPVEASINPTTVSFDKNTGGDITVTLNPGSYTLNGIANSSYTLIPGTDYTVSGNIYIIKAEYFKKLSDGQQVIIFNMNGGSNPALTVTVRDNAPLIAPSIINVIVSPNMSSVYKGGTRQFAAAVEVAGSAAQTVNWSVVGGTDTEIDFNGLLTVGMNEAADTLTVIAMSTFDSTVKGAATVIVTQYGTPYSVIRGFDVFTGSDNRSAAIDAPYSKFLRLLMDGEVLDPSHYTVTGDSTVITLTENYLKTLANGTYRVLAMFADGQAEIGLTVSVPGDIVRATGVTLDKSEASVTVGNMIQLAATISPLNATDQSVAWKSSNTSIAIIDENGFVKGVNEGKATVTVTTGDGGHTATCEVTVSYVGNSSGTTDNNAGNLPKTGDSSNVVLWCTAALVSLLTCVILLVCRRRRKSNEDD